MFYELDYTALEFTDDEWMNMPRGHRTIVRDYVLNGCNSDRTTLYDDYETDYQVNKVVREYRLKERPKLQLSFTDFRLY